MSMKKSWGYVCFIMIFLACMGTNDEIITGTRSCMIYEPDGKTPSVGATVKVFAVSDSTRTVVAQSKTDNNGNYIVKISKPGTYNILASRDTFVAYQDSAFISPDTNFIKSDTLGRPGSVTGVVGLQPQHDPRTVTVQILGTDLYTNVDANGLFTLKPLAKGIYNLRVVTTLPDYTPNFVQITARDGSNDTITDTIRLIYTGIPVVMGLTGIGDTVHGTIRVQWNKTSYRDFQEYVIYRDFYNAITLSNNPIATRSDTFYVDTIFRRQLMAGMFSFSDSNEYRFKYRVAIRDNSNDLGKTYHFAEVIAASPLKVRTFFDFNIFHVAKETRTATASINDTLLYAVQLQNPTRRLKNLSWVNLDTYIPLRTIFLDTNSRNGFDTVKYAWSTVGARSLECRATDIAGDESRAIATVQIVPDPPIVNITTTKDTAFTQDTIRLHWSGIDQFGKIIRWEIDIGATGYFKDISKNDTFAIIPKKRGPFNFLNILRATDDDGNVVYDTARIFVPMFAPATYSAAFSPRYGHTSVVFDNKMWVIGGKDDNEYKNDVWFSMDGISWTQSTPKAEFSPRCGHTSVVFDNNIWVIGGGGWGMPRKNDVWNSPDGTTWKQVKGSADFLPRWWHSSVVFNDKMWVIGGADQKSLFDIWYSSDGVQWTRASNYAPQNENYSLSVAFNGKIWNISSYLYSSSDGANWVQASAFSSFISRGQQTAVIFDNKLWVMAGINSDDWTAVVDTNDVWYSANGVSNWMQISNGGFPRRHGHTSVVFNNRMWILGGISYQTGSKNDVWYSY